MISVISVIPFIGGFLCGIFVGIVFCISVIKIAKIEAENEKEQEKQK